MAHDPKESCNHNLDSVAPNYPCPVSRLRVISHNKTKFRDNGTHEKNYFLSIMPMQVYNTPVNFRMGTVRPLWGPGCKLSMIYTLMVGAPGSPAPTPPRGTTVDVFYIDSGRSCISVSTSQGARRQCFLALMVGALGSLALTPPRGEPSTFLRVDGGCSRISSSGTSRGTSSMFFTLMVDAPGSPALARPRGATIDVS
jgi:hypothetical protein